MVSNLKTVLPRRGKFVHSDTYKEKVTLEEREERDSENTR